MIPDNIKKHRPKGTEIHKRGNYYYVYNITSVWDKEKKRPKKKTLGCVGKITEADGFIPNKKSQQLDVQSVQTKEYGGFSLLSELNRDLIDNLKKSFPSEYQRIFTIALLRVLTCTPFTSIDTPYIRSYASDVFPNLALSKNSIGYFLDYVGNNRGKITEFLKSTISDGDLLLFDGTSLFTDSKITELVKKGYNNNGKSKTQVNLLYAFNKSTASPSYYRILPGNVVDKVSFKNTILEMNIKDCVIVGDKGFYSTTNMGYLKKNNLKFILPLMRNSTILENYQEGLNDTNKYEGFFMYNKRPIWYRMYENGSDYIYQFYDSRRKETKEIEYLSKIDENYGGYTLEDFREKNKYFGAFSFISNMKETPKKIYETYKCRWEIEAAFNNLKNNLGLDNINVSSKARVEGVTFLNHISLKIYYSLINKMKENDLFKKHTANEILTLVSNIMIVTINGKSQYISETTKKEKELILSLGLDLSAIEKELSTQNLGNL